MTFITGGVWKGVWTGIVLLVLQQIDGNLLGPKIMGDSLEIRPLWIIFAVTVGGGIVRFYGNAVLSACSAIFSSRLCQDYFIARVEEKMSRK